jgi:hypothetical protein
VPTDQNAPKCYDPADAAYHYTGTVVPAGQKVDDSGIYQESPEKKAMRITHSALVALRPI